MKKILEEEMVLLETRLVCHKTLLLDAMGIALFSRRSHSLFGPWTVVSAIAIVNETSRGSADHSL